jgi:hypothetical protein
MRLNSACSHWRDTARDFLGGVQTYQAIFIPLMRGILWSFVGGGAEEALMSGAFGWVHRLDNLLRRPDNLRVYRLMRSSRPVHNVLVPIWNSPSASTTAVKRRVGAAFVRQGRRTAPEMAMRLLAGSYSGMLVDRVEGC